MEYLVETALLGHGLISIENNEILSIWPKGAMLAWVEKGKIRIGTIEEFLPAREESNSWKRLDGLTIKRELGKDINAFLTASATMVVAKEINCPIVITAGMGGIGDIKEEKLCYDLPALTELGITLIATSPKDMLNISATLDWLYDHGVEILGFNTDICNGYIAVDDSHKLSGKLNSKDMKNLEYGSKLILNPIPEEKRIKDSSLLERAIESGKKAEKNKEDYHPAANACFDRLSSGLSSRIQLESLIQNIEVGKLIIKNR